MKTNTTKYTTQKAKMMKNTDPTKNGETEGGGCVIPGAREAVIPFNSKAILI
jgi:hypothetical protein